MTTPAEKLPDGFPGPFDSNICGNDASNRENSQRLNRAVLGRPFLLRVRWKSGRGGEEKLVGCYRLDLGRLLAGGYIYTDPDGSPRLKIQHDGGDFWIRRTRHGPSWRLD